MAVSVNVIANVAVVPFLIYAVLGLPMVTPGAVLSNTYVPVTV